MRLGPLLPAIVAAATLAASPAAAQVAVSRSPATAPSLGRVVAGSSTTVFSVSAGGAVTRTSGDAIRLTTAGVTAPTVTVTCMTLVNCTLRDVRVTVTASGGSGGASITRFRIGTLSGGTYRTSAPAEGASLTFDLRPLGMGGSASFPLGVDVSVTAGSLGDASYSYSISVVML
jgi:hypothetical protein